MLRIVRTIIREVSNMMIENRTKMKRLIALLLTMTMLIGIWPAGGFVMAEGENTGSDSTDAGISTPTDLQALIDDAINASENPDDPVVVVLKKGTIFGNDQVEVKSGDKKYSALQLNTEDAGEDGLSADGSTQLTGNFFIDGINVMLKGLAIAGKIDVKNGTLNYFGTKADDKVDVTADEKSTVTVETGEGADTVNAENSGNMTIATGDGNDTVTVKDTSAGELTVATGDGEDSVTATVEKGKATINTQDGNDAVNLSVQGSEEVEVTLNTGDGEDQVLLTSDARKGTVDVKTGEGDDTVVADVRTGGSSLTIDLGEGNDNITLANQAGKDPSGEMTVNLGKGNDKVELDLSLAEAVAKLTLNDEDGADYMHISGTLRKLNGKDDSNASGIIDNMKLQSLTADGQSHTLNIVQNNIESIIDTLENKKTVKLTPKDGTAEYTAEEGDAFSDFTITVPAKDLKKIQIKTKDGKPLPLTKLLVNTASDWDGETKLLIKKDALIDVEGMALLLQAQNIEVNGTIIADQVDMRAEAGTGKNTPGFGDLYSHFEEEIEVPGLAQAGAGVAAVAATVFNLNVKDDVSIVLGEDSAIYSKNDVNLIATVDQTGGLFDINKIFTKVMTAAVVAGSTMDAANNAVNVKLASAAIELNGKLYAGVSNMAEVRKAMDAKSDSITVETNGTKGSVNAEARITTSMGLTKKDQPYSQGLALGVSVAVLDASVTVGEKALIQASKDVTLKSSSDLKASTRADSGTFGAPFAVGVAVLLNDSKATVDGKIVSGGNVTITADGNLRAATVADRGDQKGVSGFFAALTVAMQDVLAEIGSTAEVTAKGNVKVTSTANEKVTNRASSSAIKDENGYKADDKIFGKIRDILHKKVLPKITGFFTKRKAQANLAKKLEKAIDKIPDSNKSVKLDDYAEQKGTVTTDIENVEENGEEKTNVVVKIKPWEGYYVDEVMIRGYMPGDNKWWHAYKSLDEDDIEDGTVTVKFDKLKATNMVIFVEYKELTNPSAGDDEDTWQPDDLFNEKEKAEDDDTDLMKLLNDVQSGTDDDNTKSDLDKILDKEKDIEMKVDLVLPKDLSKGSVLTYDYYEGKEDENLTYALKGEDLRLVPNPAAGKKLKTGGLKIEYYVKEKPEGEEEEKEVKKTAVVNADSQGRYIVKVPENLIRDKKLKVTAEFIDDTDNKSAEADESQTQLTGTVAVTVAINDSRAIIDAGAKVVAGGSVDAASDAHTDVYTLADGSSVTKDSISPVKKQKDELAIDRPEAKDYVDYDPNDRNIFSLTLEEAVNGTVEYKAIEQSNSGSSGGSTGMKTTDDIKDMFKYTDANFAYSFTPKAVEGYQLASATVSYMSDGKLKTWKLKKNDDGTYQVKLKKNGKGNYIIDTSCIDFEGDEPSTWEKIQDSVIYNTGIEKDPKRLDKGTNISVHFAFAADSGVVGEYKGGQETQKIIPHVIQMSYNTVKDAKENTKTGDMTFEGLKENVTLTDGGTAGKYYAFKVTPVTANGYVLDTEKKVKATWIDPKTQQESDPVELIEKDGLWYLDYSKLPTGTAIKVTTAFKEVTNAFKAENTDQNGEVKLHEDKLKRGDSPKISLNPKDGYAVDDVTVTYTAIVEENGEKKEKTVTLKLSDSESKITKAKDKDGKEIAGVYTFDLKDELKEGSEIKVSATFKNKDIGINKGTMDDDKNIVVAPYTAKGEIVTVTPNAELVKAGQKVVSMQVEFTKADGTTEKKTITGNSFDVKEDYKSITVIATLGQKSAQLNEAKLENGTVTPVNKRADGGEMVTVTVKPGDGFKVKNGTLKAIVKSSDGASTEEVFLVRVNDTTYKFEVPSYITGNAVVTFEGEFEKGQSDSSAVDTSLGAGIAVAVVNSESRADVKGAVTMGGNLTIKSAAGGEIKTESKAGYSKGNTGIGGAVSVQVAGIDSKALVHKNADIKLDGNLTIDAASDVTFGVNADASGNKGEAKKVGVGAGIAVAVNGGDTYAAVQDGAKLGTNQATKIKSISITANQKVTDTVNAKAGAAGGTAVVPVAAVDVTSVEAKAFMGKAADKLNLEEGLNVSAVAEGTHTITADASAAGKGAGVGAAIVVDVVNDGASAKLNNSVEAGGNVSVSSDAVSTVTATATASASGGKKEKEGKDNSPDKQADGLLGSAKKLSGNNKSSSANGGKIDGMTKDRQKSETSEGTVGVAGALALNIQSSGSRSEIMKGVNVKTPADVAVISLNRTTSLVKANASTTNSDIGVGVGIALNIIFLDNIAKVGDGTIEAALLKVAANTKMKEPEPKAETVKPATEKVDNTDGLAKQIGEKAGEFVNYIVKEVGLDQVVSSTLLGEIVNPVVTAATNELIKASGLNELLGGGDFDEKYANAKQKLTTAAEGLAAMYEEFVAPLMDVMGDAVDIASLTPNQVKVLTENVTGKLKDKILSQLEKSGVEILKSAKDGVIDYLKSNMFDILSGVLSGDVEAEVEKVFDEAKNAITASVKAETKKLVSAAIQETLLDAETYKSILPDLDQDDIDRIVKLFNNLKDAYQKDELEKVFTEAGNKVLKSFKENVFDYEAMLQKIAKTDFKKLIVDGLKNAAKKASVTLSNEVIGALSDHFGLALAPAEAKATGHVVSTQAMAGAGARDVGVAGSVAVTVLNGETSATIADGGDITVTKDLDVNADKTIKVKNTASAVADAKGNAGDNKAAKNEAAKDVSGGSADTRADCNHVSMETATGATLKILTGDTTEDRPNIYVTLKEGYKFDEKDGKPYAEYTYTKDGSEVKGTVVLSQNKDGQWYVNPNVGDLSALDSKTDVHLELKPVEVLNNITIDEPLTDDEVTVGKDALTVTVKDREQEEGKLQARAGETVQIKIKKAAGRKLLTVGYSWTDKDGNNHDVEFNNENADDKKEKVFTLVSSTKDEYVYTFTMPDGEVTSVLAAFEKGEEPDVAESETTTKDDKGKSVGVGAAFSVVYGGNTVKAEIGKRKVTAGEMSVIAVADHKEDISAAAGTDPLSGNAELEKTPKFSVDASVAVNIVDMDVQAGIASGAVVETKGYTDDEGTKDGNLTVTATEKAKTQATTSAYAAGGKTAVGASVAVNIAITSAQAMMAGEATVAGEANIAATSHSEDITTAIATAMGADIARNLAKLGQATDNIEKKGNKLLDGSYVDELDKKKEEEKKDSGKKDDKKGKTDTGDMINKRLDEKKKDGGKDSSAENGTGSNVLRTMGVKPESEDSGEEGTQPANDFIKEKTGVDLPGSEKKEKKDDSTWQVAAAIGVTVADHNVGTTVGKITAGKAISVTAENTGNFNTMGTGAAMSRAEHANAIAAGVAVSVNDNKAKVKATGDLVAGGNLTLKSKLTQNLDGEFAGKLAAQSLAGSVAGNNSQISLGGAISWVWSDAESSVDIAGGTSSTKRKLEGADILVEATDKSRLAARAGGLSISKGSSVGMGIASTTIVSSNDIKAAVGNDVSITGSSFKLNAEKQAVTWDDYKNPLQLRKLATDSSQLSEEERKNADTGILDLHKGDSDDSYKMKINLSSDKLLGMMDGLNFLSGQNTYAEAIAGSVMTGKHEDGSKLSLAGSFAVAVTDNTVAATLGRNATVTLTKDETHTGDMTVNASNAATTRIIAGSLSAAPAKASVGATIAVLVTDDEVKAETGSGTVVNAGGNFTQNAETKSDIQVFTAAMSVAYGDQVGTAAGGAINVIVSRNKNENKIGDNAKITSGGSANITSTTVQDLWAISGSANVTAGKGEGATYAAGGTINVIYDKSQALNKLGSGVTVTAAKDVNITSDVSDQLISGVAAISVAASKDGKAGAGVINFLWSESKADTTVGQADISATAGDVNVNANNDAWMLNAGLSVAGADKGALGAAFNVDVFKRHATVNMDSGTVTAGRDLKVQSSGRDTSILAALSASGAAEGNALSGTIAFQWEANTIGTTVSKGITATAGRNALLESYFSDFTVGATGSIAVSFKEGAFGLATVNAVKNNAVSTEIAASTVTANNAKADDKTKSITGKEINGVYVGAQAEETQFMAAAGVAGGKETSASGEIVVLVNSNMVLADAAQAILKATSGEANVAVAASDNTKQTLLAGGLNISAAGSALGGAVVTIVSNKTVTAKGHDMEAAQDVSVNADNSDDIATLAVSVGLGKGTAVEIGAAVQVLKSKVNAIVGSEVTAHNGNFDLKSTNNTTLTNIAGALAASYGGGAAVAPVGAVTYFQGESNAVLESGTVNVTKGNVNISSEAIKKVGLYTLGISAGTGFGLSGAANILVSKDKAYAGTKAGTEVTATAGNVNITTNSNYKLRAISGAVSASKVAVGVNAVVSVLKSNATAELGGNGTAGKEMNVKAIGNRDVINAAATVAAGQFSGGITVMVLVAGSKMSQDAADMVAYGNSDSRDTKAGFDASLFMENAEKAGIDMNAINEGEEGEDNQFGGKMLAGDIEGNGHYESKESVGSTENGEVTFDGASGYRSSELDTKANDTDNENNRGEKLDAKDTTDITKAKNMNTYTYGNPDDAIIARILKDVTVKANTVNVEASSGAAIDLIGAAVAVGQVGAGISTVVAILHSNVSASSMGNIEKATGGVNVKALSVSGKFVDDHDADERNEAVGDLMSNKPVAEDASEEDKKKAEEEKKSTLAELADKLTTRSIRVFSVAVGAGQVGLAVAVSVVLTDNVTQAILGGKVEESGEVNVFANHNYGSVMAATGSLAVGQFAAGASVSVAQANGTVKALVADGTTVKTNEGKNVKVATDTNVGVDSIAVTAGGGMGAINAAVALSFNRLNQETGIGSGTTINSGKDIIVNAVSKTTANSYLLGVSVGGVGVALNAAVNDVDADINTHIGGADKESTITAAGDIKVYNDTVSAAVPKVLAVAAGGVAVGGNVLLAFNDTKAKAGVTNANITANNMSVIGDIGAEATSSLAAVQVGAIAVGLSVNYADLHAENRAFVTDSKIDLTGNLDIMTGVGEHRYTNAVAHTISGNMGLISVGMNAAIARNNTKNYAYLTGTKTVKVGGNMTVQGGGEADTTAALKGLSIGLADVAVSAVVSLNDADNRTEVKLSGDTTVTGTVNLNASQIAETTANMVTGGGSLLSVKVNAAIAYGRARSIVKAEFEGENNFGAIKSVNIATDTVTADISNQSFDFISASARFAGAYSQELFSTMVVVSGTETNIGDDVDVKTDYIVNNSAKVTPSKRGVDVSLASLAVNVAMAKNTAEVASGFEAVKGVATVGGNVNVLSTGAVDTSADVRYAAVSVGGAKLGANIAKADTSQKQEAHLRVGGILDVTGKVDVQSVANSATANATIASTGTDKGFALDLAHLDVSRAISRENMQNTAALVGGPVGTAIEYDKIDEGEYVTTVQGHFNYEVLKYGEHVVRDDNGVVQKQKGIVVQYNTGEVIIYDANNPEKELKNTCVPENDGKRIQISRRKQDVDKIEVGEYYEWIEESVTEWKTKLVDRPRKADIYNADQNKLTSASLNIYSGILEGTQTGSIARTDGPTTVTLVAAGSLDANAVSTDTFSVVFEGMRAVISGKATLKAETSTIADARGATPGKLSIVDTSSSNVTARVGERKDRQTVSIVIGKGNSLTAKSIDITTNNSGSAVAWLDQGTNYGLGSVKKTSTPTESFYNTLISVGRDARLRATGGDINITSNDAPQATSKVDTSNYSLTMNFNTMMGKNSIDQENNIDFGGGSEVSANGNIKIETAQRTLAHASTKMTGGSVVEGSAAKAENNIYRVARVNVGEGASIHTDGEGNTLTILASSGMGDNIYTEATVSSGGLVALGDAKAYANVKTYTEVLIDKLAKIESQGDLLLDSRATSHNDANEYNAGIVTKATVDAAAGIPMPNTVAKNTLKFQAIVEINKDPDAGKGTATRARTSVKSVAGNLTVNASNEYMAVYAYASSIGAGGAGVSNANAWNAADLLNGVWIDDADLEGNNIYIYADNGGTLKSGDASKKAHIVSRSYTKLMAALGKVQPDSRITGQMINQIRSYNTANVKFTTHNGGKVVHETVSPKNSINQDCETDYKRIEILGISLTKANEISIIKWYVANRCDFCGTGTEYDIDRTVQEGIDKRYEDAFKKALSPIGEIARSVSNAGSITKARYGEEDYNEAGRLFVLELKSMLMKDVILNPNKVKSYRLWTNSETFLNTYLMPNAARLYTNGSGALQYAVDVLEGDLFGDGRNLDIEILTALTANAINNPVIPVGSTGSLDLNTGVLTLPSNADYELYLNEISGKWLLDNLQSGYIRTLMADTQEVNDFALEGNDLPVGEIIETLLEDETGEPVPGIRMFWIGNCPETAEDPDEPLVCLVYNEETDEIDACRTSKRMAETEEFGVDASLYLYRDSKSDRMGEEKYNVIFFDTPDGEQSLVKCWTDVLAGRKMEMPNAMKIVLRGQYLEGADKPVYTLADHAIIMCDGTDGKVDILGGYHATFDGDVFDSNYTRIEGIRSGDLQVTIKEGQPVWPEWTGKDSAVDIGGTRFQIVDDEWQQIPEDETFQAGDDGEDAA